MSLGVPPPRVTGLYTVDALVAGDPLLAVNALWHLALPGLTLSFTSSPPIFNVTRNAVAAVLASPYVEAARSYGIPERGWSASFASARRCLFESAEAT
jgi:peptide/nickel transport system permease protein